MKQWYGIIILVAGIGFGIPAAAEEIRSFDASIALQSDASMTVRETIEYDFGSAERHGIYRDIPLKSRAWYGSYGLRIRDVRVSDEKGTPVPFSITNKNRGKRIRIGDPNVLVSGLHTYRIDYTVDRAVTYHDVYDELYWNVTGNEWEVPMRTASADVLLPAPAAGEQLTFRCYEGPFGSQTGCDVATFTDEEVRGMRFANSHVASGDGLTFVVQFPKGLAYEPGFFEKARFIIMDNGIAAVPFLAFFIMWYLWYTRGRDPKGRGTIIPEYDVPDRLTPAEIGTIIDEVTNNKDIAAEIVYLAIRGFIVIRQEETEGLIKDKTEYRFIQMKPIDGSLASYQRTLLEGLFGDTARATSHPGGLKEVRLSDLKNTFAATLAEVKREAMASVVEKGYFQGNPNAPKILYPILGILTALIGFAVSGGSPLAIGSFVVSGGIIALFGIFMPKRSYQGVLTKEHILGLKEYLRVAEADRLKFHNAPEKKPEVFEKLLPFAMVLGVEKEWAGQFKDIYGSQPDWYEGGSLGHFNAGVFVGNLNAFSARANSVLSSSPSAGAAGGGFSGGGFGGGGGGSW